MKTVLYGIFALAFFAIGVWLMFMGDPWIWTGPMALSIASLHAIAIEIEDQRFNVLQSTLLKLLKEKHGR